MTDDEPSDEDRNSQKAIVLEDGPIIELGSENGLQATDVEAVNGSTVLGARINVPQYLSLLFPMSPFLAVSRWDIYVQEVDCFVYRSYR